MTTFHRELGLLVWDKCGMARDAQGLQEALQKIPAMRAEFWENVNVLGDGREFNQALEHAGRVADFLEFAELMCLDALERNESCGCHFRLEYQTKEGEALRNDNDYCYVAAWEYAGPECPTEPDQGAADFRKCETFSTKLQMNFKLKVWRQKDGVSPGSFKDYDAKDIPSEASFLEMLDIVNEALNGTG